MMNMTEHPDDQMHQQTSDQQDNRLQTLCDGVFAIAMTLLVLDIRLPDQQYASATAFQDALGKLVPKILSYIISFFVIATYWSGNHRLMRVIRHQDEAFMWLTFLFLAFIAFFPVASSINGQYGNYASSIILYTFVLAGCGFSSFFLWLYSSFHHRLIDPTMPQREIVTRSILLLIAPIYFSLSLLLLLVIHDSGNVLYSWLFVPFVYRIIRNLLKSKAGSSLTHR